MSPHYGNEIVSLRSGNLSSVQVDDDHNDDTDERSQEVAAEVLRRIGKKFPSTQRKSGVLSLLHMGRSSSLNLSKIKGLNTLRGEVVQAVRRNGVKRLDLSKNESMVVVPATLVCKQDHPDASLMSLQVLDLSKCQIVILPEDWDLPNLKTLDLSNNRIRDFPSQSVLKGIPLLEELNLYGNRLTHVPSFGDVRQQLCKRDAFSRTPSASSSSMQVPNTHAPTGPSSVSSRSKPTRCKSRQRCALDASILTHLTYLNIGYNDIAQLPARLPNKLKTLIACNNMLLEIPPLLILSLEELKECDVSSNPVREPPLEICQAGVRSIRRYVQKRTQLEYWDTEDTASRENVTS